MRRSLFAVGLGFALLYSVQTYVGGQKVPLAGSSAAPSGGQATAGQQTAIAGTVEQQVASLADALAKAKQVGKPVPVTITVTERQLTDAAATHFPVSYAGASLTDPVVRLVNGQLRLDSSASLAIIHTTAVVLTTPTVTAGRPSVRVDSATLAGQPLPDAARSALASKIASAIAAEVPANLAITSIAVGAGTLTLQGTANP